MGKMSIAQVRELVARYFEPQDIDTMMRIVEKESGFDPMARNVVKKGDRINARDKQPKYAKRDQDNQGLTSINKLAHPKYKHFNLFNPEVNIAIASELAYEQGFGIWGTYGNKET